MSIPPIRLEAQAEPVPGYRLESFLGRGGFGQVWRAVGPGGFPVALKFLTVEESGGARELESLRLLQHVRDTHLLSLFGVWEAPGYHILAMELADGTLADRLEECRREGLPGVPGDELREYFRQAAAGLDFLNEPRHPVGEGGKAAGIQHGDVKPQNLFLVGSGVKVGDFGLLRRMQQSIVTRKTGGLTFAYAAPEVFRGRVARQTDQYSLAVSWCQLRGGRLPFSGDPAGLMAGHLLREPDLEMLPPSERPAARRALAKEPRERWPSCRAFAEALAASTPATPPLPAPTTPAVLPPTADPLAEPPTAPLPPRPVPTNLRTPAAATDRRKEASSTAPPAPTRSDEELESPAPDPADEPPIERPARRTTWKGPRRSWVGPALGLGAALLLTAAVAVGLAWTTGAHHGASNPSTPQPPSGPQPFTNDLGLHFVYLPPGSFVMGSPPDEEGRNDDETPHRVTLTHGFYLSSTLVTEAQWEAVLGPPALAGGPGGDKKRMPAHNNISWEDAERFCRALGRRDGRRYRLPTEAEWEYACRAGTQTPFWFGASITDQDANYDARTPYGKGKPGVWRQKPTPVDQFKPSPWGLYDMHGNLYEWCADWYGPYPEGDVSDPQGPKKGDERVRRGGSWVFGPARCRGAARDKAAPAEQGDFTGVRVACGADGGG
jgi:formylglycine-generating enzyme required for sulfatase activity